MMDAISSRLMILTGAFIQNGNGGSGSVIKLGSSRLIDMDNPPNSRIFIVCSKNHTEAELKYAFEKFGDMEDIWLVKDKTDSPQTVYIWAAYGGFGVTHFPHVKPGVIALMWLDTPTAPINIQA
ncbi:PREDICTED: uncharacterized protein LOC109486540 [Branchiostoma belcheri]|uniref:Uncharacterized protein LOC109486540 n=1 Tax=Branchiostoma belcheri TaxID=7741 RepID=A0A6P5AVE1_BRABE|nr:PREDICTED: uncharacterized protein LOC109486540 [Branchiostoma belcheri]